MSSLLGCMYRMHMYISLPKVLLICDARIKCSDVGNWKYTCSQHGQRRDVYFFSLESVQTIHTDMYYSPN